MLKKIVNLICTFLISFYSTRIVLNYLYIKLDYGFVKIFVRLFDKCKITKNFIWRDIFLDKEILYPVISDYQTSWNIALSSQWHEPEVRKFIEFFIDNNNFKKVFYDIGSNHGLFSFPFLVYGYECYLFEPQEVCNEYVNKIANINRFSSIINKSIVSNAPASGSKTEFYISDSTFYSSINKSHVEMFEDTRKILVNNITLDEFTGNKNNLPSIMKIDVEGSESEVIKGAKNLIHTAKPTIIMEILNDNRSKIDFYNYFKSEFYKIYYYNNNILKELTNPEEFSFNKSSDYFFLQIQN